ncbi:MAG TPA: chromate transporter [Burkholderiaceae bacterium]|nr:chromate transporter [Burkholderiaceae bacterium]
MTATVQRPTADAAVLRAPRSKTELFVVFTWLALQGFGGVLAVAQRELVERQRWLSKEQFVELLSLSQVLPGPNVINLSLMFGDRHFGWRGALAAVAGMLGAPLVIVLTLAAVYVRFSEVSQVAGALRGMGAVASGLILATAFKLAPTLRRNPMGLWPCALMMLASALAIGWLRWPLVWVVLVLGLGGFAWAWRQLSLRRRRASP